MIYAEIQQSLKCKYVMMKLSFFFQNKTLKKMKIVIKKHSFFVCVERENSQITL